MGKKYNNNITTGAGFNYESNQPLDDREVVQSFEDLAGLLSYEGIEVYVVDDKKSYKLIDSMWKPVATEDYADAALSEITNQLDNKVDKIEGKGLSTNDFTNEDKNKLDNLAETVSTISNVYVGDEEPIDENVVLWVDTDEESIQEFATEEYVDAQIANLAKSIPETSNVYVGDEEPIDENVVLWVDTDEEADIPSGVIIDQSYSPTSANAQSGVAVAEALKTIEIPTQINNLSDGAANGSLNTVNATAIAENSFAEGNNTIAGSKAFKIYGLGILEQFLMGDQVIQMPGGKISTAYVDAYLNMKGVHLNLSALAETTYVGYYVVSDVTDISAGMICLPYFETSRGSVEFVVEAMPSYPTPYGNVSIIATANFDPNATLYEGSEEGNHNYLTFIGRPNLGDMNIGDNAHAQGKMSSAQGSGSHAGGLRSVAAGNYSFAQGAGATAGHCAAAIGQNVSAVGDGSIAVGLDSVANGKGSFAAGINSYALDNAAFAFGANAVAKKIDSKAIGMGAWALGENQFVTGKYNKLDPEGKYAFMVGNGLHDEARTNAIAVDWTGNGFFSGDVYANSDEGQQLEGRRLVTKAELEKAMMGDLTNLTWPKVQEIVRLGYAPTFFPVGYEFEVKSTYSGSKPYIFQVVAHDYLKNVDDENAPTMTLMSKNVFEYAWSTEFDATEKAVAASSFHNASTAAFEPVQLQKEMPKNKYYYCSLIDPYGSCEGYVAMSFWSNKTIPAGKYLAHTPSNPEYGDFSLNFIIFDDADPTTSNYMSISDFGEDIRLYKSLEEIPEYIIKGTELTVGLVIPTMVEGSSERSLKGSNNYKESAIRQYINSLNNDWWTRQTLFDNPPSYVKNEGFLTRFDQNFLKVIGTVTLPCSGNSIYEVNEENLYNYTLQDKFYLPSYIEVAGYYNDITAVNDLSKSKRLPFYEDAANVDRIKTTLGSEPAWWMLRTPHTSETAVKVIADTGSPTTISANSKCAFPVMCTIV